METICTKIAKIYYTFILTISSHETFSEQTQLKTVQDTRVRHVFEVSLSCKLYVERIFTISKTVETLH